MSLTVGHLWTGLINAWFSLAGYGYILTFPLGFGTGTKLLYHSDISPTPNVLLPAVLVVILTLL